MNEATCAKRILVHYMRTIAERAGMPWDSDYTAELEGVIDDIVKAAATEGARQALRALPPSMVE